MKAVISLGSNLENKKLNLDIAVIELEIFLTNLIISPYIQTAPVGGPIQDDFLNAVVMSEIFRVILKDNLIYFTSVVHKAMISSF